MAKKKINPLAVANMPRVGTEQSTQDYSDFSTVFVTYQSIMAALNFITQLIEADNENRITLTEEDRLVLQNNYQQLKEILEPNER
jgi:hypothetical protein